eukprot:CAMPEP_0179053458 /NCGR_PEP_ID=MMETSP0796-20121207/22284_1 /TAXON_ID=73915 /ORGANISM="Pyrodinium bahamense, Strain pbaha01" /LENGTH=42 /DNA_ID= /DNA_START= /DNA_END= /DNA_ORIENTATION=
MPPGGGRPAHPQHGPGGISEPAYTYERKWQLNTTVSETPLAA